MKPITLHPGSLLTGIGVAVLAFVAMGQSVVQLETGETEMPTRPPAFAIHPRDWVQIEQGQPYTVLGGHPKPASEGRLKSGQLRG